MASTPGFSPLQKAFVLLVVLSGTDLLRTFAGPGPQERLLELALLIPMLALTALYVQHFLRAALAVPELILVLVLAVVSVAWSVAPTATLNRAVPMLVASCFMLTVASLYSMRQVLLLLGAIATCTALASLLAVALVPSARGAPPWDDVWRGVFNHKNGLGSASAFGLLLAGSAALVAQGRLRVWLILGALLNAYLLLVSGSRTSQLIAIVGVASLLLALVPRRKLASSAMILLAFLLGMMLAYAALTSGWLDPIFAAAGRKPTLSGRLPLWDLTWPFVTERLWLGWGYLAFWDPESYRVLSIAQSPTLRFVPFYSHSGLIETLLNVGLVGLLLLLIYLGRVFSVVLRLLGKVADGRGVIASFTFVLCFLVHNVTESSVLERNSLIWMQFVLITAKLCLVGAASARPSPVASEALRHAGT